MTDKSGLSPGKEKNLFSLSRPSKVDQALTQSLIQSAVGGLLSPVAKQLKRSHVHIGLRTRMRGVVFHPPPPMPLHGVYRDKFLLLPVKVTLII
jgi:hypothetical protein